MNIEAALLEATRLNEENATLADEQLRTLRVWHDAIEGGVRSEIERTRLEHITILERWMDNSERIGDLLRGAK